RDPQVQEDPDAGQREQHHRHDPPECRRLFLHQLVGQKPGSLSSSVTPKMTSMTGSSSARPRSVEQLAETVKRRKFPCASPVDMIDVVFWATHPSQNRKPSLRCSSSCVQVPARSHSSLIVSAPPSLYASMLKSRLSSKKLARRSGLARWRFSAAGWRLRM